MGSGRNAPCPCGSGRRYKHCHGQFASGDPDVPAKAIDFVVAGAQRSGTTALDLYMRGHPGVAMPVTRKELHFFDHDEHFGADRVDYSAYHANFDPAHAGRLRGEATPSYMYWNPAAERLARYNPRLRIVVALRNPITRAYSHWNKERQRGREPLSFHDALLAERARAAARPSGQSRRTSYADRGFYVGQLERLWRHFPVDQTLVLRSEALQSDHAQTLAQIAEFLGLGPFPRLDAKSANARAYEAPMPADDWNRLAERFAGEIRALERLLGWDCADWLGSASG